VPPQNYCITGREGKKPGEFCSQKYYKVFRSSTLAPPAVQNGTAKAVSAPLWAFRGFFRGKSRFQTVKIGCRPAPSQLDIIRLIPYNRFCTNYAGIKGIFDLVRDLPEGPSHCVQSQRTEDVSNHAKETALSPSGSRPCDRNRPLR